MEMTRRAPDEPAPPAPLLPRALSASVVAVSLRQHDGQAPRPSRGIAAGAAAVALEQLRLTLVALCLALTVAPFAAAMEPLLELLLSRYEVPSPPCLGLLTDGRSADIVVEVLLSVWLTVSGITVAAVEPSPRSACYLINTLVTGAAGAVLYAAVYVSATSSRPGWLQTTLLCTAASTFVVWLPFVTHASWKLATAARKRVRRALLQVASGLASGVMCGVIGATLAFYVYLSDQVSGLTGVVVNGEDLLSLASARRTANSFSFFQLSTAQAWPTRSC